MLVLCHDIEYAKAKYEQYNATCLLSYRYVGNNLESCNVSYYARHSGFPNWWYQSNNHKVMVQSDHDSPNESLPQFDNHSDGFVILYVLNEYVDVARYKVDMFKCFGGQDRLFCGCDGSTELNPMTVTGRVKTQRIQCSAAGCNQKEHYVCSKCDVPLCNRCYSKLIDKDSRITLLERDWRKLKKYGAESVVNLRCDCDDLSSQNVSCMDNVDIEDCGASDISLNSNEYFKTRDEEVDSFGGGEATEYDNNENDCGEDKVFFRYDSNEHSDLGSIEDDETSVDERDVELSELGSIADCGTTVGKGDVELTKFDRVVANEKLFQTRKGDERNYGPGHQMVRLFHNLLFE